MPIVFTGKGTPMAAADFAATATALGGDAAALWSLVGVETHGFGYFADRSPQILFERHIFHARTGGRFDAAHPDISNRTGGGYIGGVAEYGRLERAMALSEKAALESASWGMGQVMGFNAPKLGYADVYAMIAAMVAGEAAQLQAVAAFIRATPALDAAFRARHWAQVAFYYNGKTYAAQHYDTNLASHYAIYANAADRPDLDLRTAQTCLLYLGYLKRPGDVDGLTGPATRAALLSFRTDKGLPAGGLDTALLAQLRVSADV